MGAFAVPADEQLTINSFNLFTPACSILNSYVMEQGTTVAIDNTDIPDHDGSRAEQPWGVESQWTLALSVTGVADFDGDPHPDARVGLRENWTAIKAGVFLPILASSTLPATWEYRGEIRTADVQVANWQIIGASPVDYDATFDLIIPAGEWTVVGS
jgi:hypothetical protein